MGQQVATQGRRRLIRSGAAGSDELAVAGCAAWLAGWGLNSSRRLAQPSFADERSVYHLLAAPEMELRVTAQKPDYVVTISCSPTPTMAEEDGPTSCNQGRRRLIGCSSAHLEDQYPRSGCKMHPLQIPWPAATRYCCLRHCRGNAPRQEVPSKQRAWRRI